jgi:hypothetical protein
VILVGRVIIVSEQFRMEMFHCTSCLEAYRNRPT